MSESITAPSAGIVSKEAFLNHWLGHRSLTRRVIEVFPEKEFFSFSIGGMRTFADICKELLAIAGPGVKEIASGKQADMNEKANYDNSKEGFLKQWDEDTNTIKALWKTIPEERFGEKIKAFGQYEGTVLSTIQYYVDNEIHHRGQGYVYLRALEIEPPPFWER